MIDMVMPNGLNGSDTYEQIIAINPKQKAIIVSGYPEEIILNEINKARNLGAGLYLRKPYTFTDIGKVLKSELEKP